jgi:hypothetical protein
LRGFFTNWKTSSNPEFMSKRLWIERFLGRAALAVCFAVFLAPFVYCQARAPLTLDNVSNLLKGGVSSRRVAQLIRENGVGFKLDQKSLKRLKEDGAGEDIFVAIKKNTTPRPPPRLKPDPRCHEILLRVQLGEVLSSEERKILEEKCS